MKLPAYPRYKPSGVEWLGDVPEHWEVWKHAHLFRSSMGQTILKEDVSDSGAIPVLSATEKYEIFGYLDSASVLLDQGDLVIPARGNSIGHVKLVRERCTTTQTTIYSKHLTKKAAPSYAFYFLFGHRNTLFQFDRTAIPQLTVNQVSTNCFLLPPLAEQQAIAAFLDRETGRVDRLVAKKRELIERLKEKRTALVSRTVTRGLPPAAARAAGLLSNPPLKPSTLDWLGDIPNHWEVMRLRRVVRRIEQGWSPECSNAIASLDEWGVVKAGCCNGGQFNPNENKALPLDLDPPHSLEIKADDLLMSRASGSEDLIGSVALVPSGTRGQLLLSDKTYRLQCDGAVAVPAFLARVLQSPIGRSQIQAVISGALGLAKNIAQSDVRDFVLAIPPLPEQAAIAAYLDMETARLDALVGKVAEAVERLQEYRAALITAAVTGKIDARSSMQSRIVKEPSKPVASAIA